MLKYLLNGGLAGSRQGRLWWRRKRALLLLSTLLSLLVFSGEVNRSEAVATKDTDHITCVLIGTQRSDKHSLEEDWQETSTFPVLGEEREELGGCGWVRGERSFESWGPGSPSSLCACLP